MAHKLKNLKLTDIKIGERFREDFGDMDEFMESIKEKGILQPVTVNKALELQAGGRRCEAARRLGLEMVPALIRDSEGETDSREVELIENIHRKDFTWQERAKLTAEIDRLYKSNNQDWSMRKTAKLIDKSIAGVSRDIALADTIDKIPEIGDCKTADEALKTIKSLQANAIQTELRRRQQEHMNAPEQNTGDTAGKANPVSMDSGIRNALRVADRDYMIGDVFKGMASLRDNGHIEFIECDPPYGIDLNTVKAGGENVDSTVQGYNEVDKKEYPEFLGKLTKELYRVAHKNCWMVFWYGPTWHTETLAALRDAGWAVDDIPATWVKGTGQTKQPNINLARSYEPFFVCRKGQPVLAKPGRVNTFFFPPVTPKEKYHPTQRPISMIEEILNTFTAGRTHVFVPFLGSGATLRACYNLGHKVFGFDLNDKYKDPFMLAVEEDSRRLLSDGANESEEE